MVQIGSTKAVIYKNLLMNRPIIYFSALFGVLILFNLFTVPDIPVVLAVILSTLFISVNISIFNTYMMVEDRANKFKIIYKVMGLRRNQYFIGSILSSIILTTAIQICLHCIILGYKLKSGYGFAWYQYEKETFTLAFFHYILLTFVAFTLSYAFRKIETARNIASIVFPLCFYCTVFLVLSENKEILKLISPFTDFVDFGIAVIRKIEINLTSYIIKLLVKTVLWGVLAIYLENVITNDDDHGKHPLFFLYYFTNNHAQRIPLAETKDDGNFDNEKNIEVKNLSKKFGNFSALSDVNIKLKAGKIHCMLGHNGAGKSTFINILIGLYKATSGKMTWMGENLMQLHMEESDKLNIGICPPNNILWDKMTVRQHLRMMCFIKNIEVPDDAIISMIRKFNLTTYVDFKVSELSGGNKRKLTIAMALIGNPNIILFDEPTSALDPVARKDIWQILTDLKAEASDKIILLTTHHLEEAETLADNIIFLANGTIKLVGTVEELKKNFGLGYLIEIITPNEQPIQFFEDLKTKIERESKTDYVFANGAYTISDRKLELKITIKEKAKINLLLDTIKQQKPNDAFVAIGTNTLERAYIEIDKNLNQGHPFANEEALKNILSKLYIKDFQISYPFAIWLIVKNKLNFLANNILELMKIIAQYLLITGSIGIFIYINKQKTNLFNKHVLQMIFIFFVYFELAFSTFSVFNLVYDSHKDIKQVMLANKIPPFVYLIGKLCADFIIIVPSYMLVFSFMTLLMREDLNATGLFEIYNKFVFSVICWKLTYTCGGFLYYRLFQTPKAVIYYYAMFYFGLFFLVQLIYHNFGKGFRILNELAIMWTIIFDEIGYARIAAEFGALSITYLFISLCIENYNMIINFRNTPADEKNTPRNELNEALLSTNQESIDQIQEKLKKTVAKEESETYESKHSNLKVLNLTKKYGFFKRNTAVNKITFNVEKKTNFGLIGPNGAGKSTVFNMLLSKINKTSGNIHIAKTPNYDLFSSFYTFYTPYQYNNYGICFQGDSIWDELTVESNLSFYCELNGIDKIAFAEFLDYFEFEHYLKKNGEDLSSGNKRKLCILISLMIDPNFLLFDEATCGIDISMRLRMKNIVQFYKSKNNLFSIFTTHFLKDIEIFCDKIGIIDKGEFLCITTIEQVKQILGGYLITISSDCRIDIQEVYSQLVENAIIKVVSSEPLIGKSKIILTGIKDVFLLFSTLLNLQNQGVLIDFTLNQLSIEDIYLDIFNRSE